MEKDTSKKAPRQTSRERRWLIERRKFDLSEKLQELDKEKITIGHPDLAWSDFLNISSGPESKIADIQYAYRAYQEEYDHVYAEDRVIEEFNRKHAVIHIEQTYILTEKQNTFGNHDFSFESRQSFKAYYEDETILCIDGFEREKTEIWLKSPQRRKYENLIFDPIVGGHNNGHYNLWKGFSKTPIKGNSDFYWAHVKEVICNNNPELYRYVRGWLAYVFQRPDVVHTALVLCGSQGVGKNSFVNPLGFLFGSHYAPLSSVAELVSNFNFHLKNAVLIHANEALWHGGNKKEIGTVKAMITEQMCLIEGKGKDRIAVKNFKHVILSSNEDWPIAMGKDDRRFCVLKVSDKRKEDREYFSAFEKALENGGYEALLYDVLHEDISDFEPRNIPSGSDSFDIKMRSADSPYRYIYEVLCEGGFSLAIDKEEKVLDGTRFGTQTNVFPIWQGEIPKNDVYQDYVEWCRNSGEKDIAKSLFGRILKETIPSILDSRPGGQQRRVRCYKLPSLKQSRIEFCRAFKEQYERIFDELDDSRPTDSPT